jgi:hypothetical protein
MKELLFKMNGSRLNSSPFILSAFILHPSSFIIFSLASEIFCARSERGPCQSEQHQMPAMRTDELGDGGSLYPLPDAV